MDFVLVYGGDLRPCLLDAREQLVREMICNAEERAEEKEREIGGLRLRYVIKQSNKQQIKRTQAKAKTRKRQHAAAAYTGKDPTIALPSTPELNDTAPAHKEEHDKDYYHDQVGRHRYAKIVS